MTIGEELSLEAGSHSDEAYYLVLGEMTPDAPKDADQDYWDGVRAVLEEAEAKYLPLEAGVERALEALDSGLDYNELWHAQRRAMKLLRKSGRLKKIAKALWQVFGKEEGMKDELKAIIGGLPRTITLPSQGHWTADPGTPVECPFEMRLNRDGGGTIGYVLEDCTTDGLAMITVASLTVRIDDFDIAGAARRLRAKLESR